MKRLLSLIVALALVGGVLYIAKADVNHGHGPSEGGVESQDASGH